MSDMLPSATRRAVLAASAAAGAASLLPAQASAAPTNSTAIRPFHIKTSNEALIDLRKRIVATKFPERETVADATPAVHNSRLSRNSPSTGPRSTIGERRGEAQRPAKFVTTIDGIDIHFIHVHSRHANALPLIMTHGWPGSILEYLKVIGPLTDPIHWRARGGRLRCRHSLDAGLRLLRQAQAQAGVRNASRALGMS